ncbi:MAG: hypothetical protein PUC06_05515 [Oscillospiraceae bacterium]|nr:hypothetical protein [Oscillospiraceae bacterium]
MVGFDGIGSMVITVKDGGVVPGQPCKCSGGKAMEKAAAGEAFQGVCLWQRDDIAGVQVDGFVTMPYTGTAPTVGFDILAADGNGGVQKSASGKSRMIVDVDSVLKTVTFRI